MVQVNVRGPRDERRHVEGERRRSERTSSGWTYLLLTSTLKRYGLLEGLVRSRGAYKVHDGETTVPDETKILSGGNREFPFYMW